MPIASYLCVIRRAAAILACAVSCSLAWAGAPMGRAQFDSAQRTLLSTIYGSWEVSQQYWTLDELYGRIAEISPTNPYGLTEMERVSVEGYTGGFYSVINGSLRDHDEKKLSEIGPYIDVLRSALAKLPAQNGTVLRVTGLTPAEDAAAQPGAIITEQGFMSTSADPTYFSAGRPGDFHLVIHSHTGKLIADYSLYKFEDEVLFPPGTRFRVLSRGKSDIRPTTIEIEEITQ